MSDSDVLDFVEENASEAAGIIMESVREALAKQIPMKPEKGTDIDGKDFCACPKCFGILAADDWIAYFCPDCGQKIDWEEDHGV